MRKLFKNILVCATAAVLAAGSAAFASCGTSFKPLEGDDYTSTEAAVSNGGFVVEYGKYVYFINGATTYEDDNTYGAPVKGALMRIKKDDFKKKTGEAQIVVPSLIVSGDYTAGFFIYNDRVYYATPNNVKSMSGEIESDWLEFKSAKLDGSDIQDYFRLSDNSTVFRFVQTSAASTVYLLYNGKKPDDNDGTAGLQSYNTTTKTCTTIAEGASSYVFNSADKTDPYVYYTMPVKNMIDTETPQTLGYNQIYRASASVTSSPYDYTWSESYLKEHDGVAPYVNLGTLVLDGVGKETVGADEWDTNVTQFTHDYKDKDGKVIAEPLVPVGYKYDLKSYTNSQSGDKSYKGLYFTREDVTKTDSEGDKASLYYLSASDFEADGWNSISGNKDKLTYTDGVGKLDVVAKPTATSNASTSAIFYIDESNGYKHHYIYVSGANMIRADVSTQNANVDEQEIWYDASGATLVRLDNRATQAEPYNYVWFTRSNGSGMSIERAVYNGKAENYETLDVPGRNNAPYKALKLLNLQHKSGWYPYEMIEDMIIFADAESVGSTSYDYIATVSLTDKNGKYLNNQEFEEQVNDKWDSLMDSDAKTGYFAKLSKDEQGNLSKALTYYFRTGKTDAFYGNIQEAVELGQEETHLYTADEQTAFKNFTEGKKLKKAEEGEDDTLEFFDGETSYRTRSYFIKAIGLVKDEDQKEMDEYWKGYLENYPKPEEKTGLEDWELALAIGVPVLAVVAAGILTTVLIMKKKKAAANEQKPERMRVDTSIDKDVDVYAANGDADGKDGE